MKIKKESLTKPPKFDESDSSYLKSSNKAQDNDPIFLNENRQINHLSAPVTKQKTIDVSVKMRGISCSGVPWQQNGILRQALLSTSISEQAEKSEPDTSVEAILPKIRTSLLSTNIKPRNDLQSATTTPRNSQSSGSFSSVNAFSTPATTLASDSSFSAISFTSLTDNPLNSNCTVSSQDSTVIMATLQSCSASVHQASLQSPVNDLLTNSTTDAIPNSDNDSSVSVASVDSISSLVSTVSTYSGSANLSQALASFSSKDDSVTVVYSSIPKVEPSSANLIHNFQKNVPLPPLSEVKSSLTNHLGALSQSENKLPRNDHSKISETISGASSNPDSQEENMRFNNLSPNETNGTLSAIKLKQRQDSSEFNEDQTLSLSSDTVKFDRDNMDITSNIVIPVSSEVMLTKIEGQSSAHQDISHIITIPLPACNIYNSSLSIPMALPLCNGASATLGSVQMSPTVLSNIPYSVTGISNQISNSCWPNPAVSLSVSSTPNSQISTSVTTSLPVSIMSVAPSLTSLQNNNVIQISSNSLPASTQVACSTVNTVPHEACYTVQSPAEILSQLSKAGVLPTMSSSQVSSVLSALGSDSHIEIEQDATNQNEILNSQILQGGFKVSTLTQTDSLEMNIMQPDEKIIQIVNGHHLLEHQVNGSHFMLPTSNQSESLHAGVSLNCSDVSSELLEPKQISAQYPRIVTMVLNSPSVRNEKFCVPSGSMEHALKKSEPEAPSEVDCSSKHLPENTSDTLQDFLILQNNSKPQKRYKKPSALRKMLLGINDSGVDKETQLKKPKLKAKKEKNDCIKNVNKNSLQVKNSCKEIMHFDPDSHCVLYSKEVGCFKCKYCPYLSIEETTMAAHVKLKHSSEMQQINIVRQELKCPGCPNVFFTTNSLEVHLKQDHQVNTLELKAIANSVIKFAAAKRINVTLSKKRKKTNSIASMTGQDVRIPASANEIPHLLVESNSNSNVGGQDTLVTNPESNSNGKKIVLKNLDVGSKLEESRPHFKNNSIPRENNIGDEKDEPKVFEDNLKAADGNFSDHVQTGDQDTVVDSKNGDIFPTLKKKRGRPKGSRTASLSSGKRPSSKDGARSSAKKNNTGHRCNIDNCAVTMRSPENIEYHRSCHSGAEFQCPECNHTHCHWNGMSTHLWRAHMVDMELYTCDQCNYKTVSYAKLFNLHKWIHGSERPFLCDSCGKGFKNRKQLRNHKTIHQPKQAKIGECEICGRTFAGSRKLRKHLDNVHNKVRPHLCNYCGYSASSVSSLKMHMRKHTGEKPFRCPLCEYVTADHNSLRRHKMRHTGDKPYKCPHCSYACIQSSTYKAHLKTKHPGMDDGLMFSCTSCTFRSVKEENYLAHVAEHKTEGFSPVKLNGIKKITLVPNFESEDVTDDISEAELITGDIGEPQEFKMCNKVSEEKSLLK